MDKTLQQGIAYAVGAIILLLGKEIYDYAIKYIKRRDIQTRFKKSINKEIIINNELASLRDKFGFNRTSLIDYHNGTESFKGLSFKNSSMRNETVDVKTKSIINEYQNIPCSIDAGLLIKLENSKDGYVISTDEGPSDSAITNRMYGIKQAYDFKLGSSLLDGVVSLVYTDERYNLSQEEILEIKASIQKISLARKKK